MKRLFFLVSVAPALLLTGCHQNTYSDLRNKEDKLIANYISRNNLNVLTEVPADDYVWGEKDYLKVPGYDNFYFHLIKRGDSIRVDSIGPNRKDTIDLTISANATIVARYKQFALTENADTISSWTTLDQAYPYEFHYMNTSDCEAVGWHLAVRYMKYPDSQCSIIQPSKLGFSTEQNSVTPYGYILKIKVKQ
ncbi:MAG: DUF4827 domain-containing protein [Paludibacteraceae bacterium]|nr:DUF4827 domain-containing protein [Paludibacteraceae bacterium]